jgi:hypothetical protein
MRPLAVLPRLVPRSVSLFLVVFSCFASCNAVADIYRSVAPDGTVTFSDEPPAGHAAVERVELPPPPASPTRSSDLDQSSYAEDLEFPTDPDASEQAPIDLAISILSPANDQALRSDDGSMAVEVAVAPALRPGDVVEILLNGRAVTRSETQVALLAAVDRGTHELVARIVDPDGLEVAISSPVTVHLLRHSSAHPPPANPANNFPPRER